MTLQTQQPVKVCQNINHYTHTQPHTHTTTHTPTHTHTHTHTHTQNHTHNTNTHTQNSVIIFSLLSDISTATPILISSGETNQMTTYLTSTQESHKQVLSLTNVKTRQDCICSVQFDSQKKKN